MSDLTPISTLVPPQVRAKITGSQITPIPPVYDETPDEQRARGEVAAASRNRRWSQGVPERFQTATIGSLTAQQNPGGIVSGWWTGEARTLLLVSEASGLGKCLTGDATVYDPVSGMPWRVGDMVSDFTVSEVHTVECGKVTTASITERIDSGVQPTVTVKTASGRCPVVLTSSTRSRGSAPVAVAC